MMMVMMVSEIRNHLHFEFKKNGWVDFCNFRFLALVVGLIIITAVRRRAALITSSLQLRRLRYLEARS